MNRPAFIACVLLAGSCLAQPERIEQRSAMERLRSAERAARMATRGAGGAVAAGTDFAADAGMRILLAGGNAVDEYSHFAFGGEAPIPIRTRKMKPGEIGNAEPGGLKAMAPTAGVLPALVSAIELAEGMPMDETRSGSIGRARKFFELWPGSKSIFLPGGRPPVPGDIFRQTGLARTLRSMAEAENQAHKAGRSRTAAIEAVRDHFYRGDIARRIDAFSRANDGLLRYQDIAAFRAEIEAPVSTTYRGATVCKPGFWSQGPSMLQAVEAPRVQTRHLVSSFDSHAMLPGDLLVDERIAADTVKALAGRGHKTQTRSRFASGAAPVMIRILGNGMIEAGADTYGYRAARAW